MGQTNDFTLCYCNRHHVAYRCWVVACSSFLDSAEAAEAKFGEDQPISSQRVRISACHPPLQTWYFTPNLGKARVQNKHHTGTQQELKVPTFTFLFYLLYVNNQQSIKVEVLFFACWYLVWPLIFLSTQHFRSYTPDTTVVFCCENQVSAVRLSKHDTSHRFWARFGY